MGLYKHLSLLHRERPDAYRDLVRKRLIDWRKEPTPLTIQHPTDLVSARRLGYKNKQGIVLVRVRMPRGQKERPSIRHGRRSAHMRQRLVLEKSYRWLAEARAVKHHKNLEVLNSYKVGKDGLHYWFEVILLDPRHPSVANDKHLGWISSDKHRGRVDRGKTSAARKSRSLLGKGKGHEKSRPSVRANLGRAK